MPEENESAVQSGTLEQILMMTIGKVFEYIGSPQVYMPLALFLIFIVAYPITKSPLFIYAAIVFAVIAWITNMLTIKRAQEPASPPPDPTQANYRDDIFEYLAKRQMQAVHLLERGKTATARGVIDDNLREIGKAVKAYPGDADFHSLMGYALKDMYQGFRGVMPPGQRKDYLDLAGASFKRALALDPDNAGAHNGMGNVLLFRGRFDDAIAETDKAIELTGGQYDAAEHDKALIMRVQSGEIDFGRL
jgi:tetratricopeptide (TPR) repeat protein